MSQNLVPKPPQGPRPSREANIAKAEKKAREVIKAKKSREAKSGVIYARRQVVGVCWHCLKLLYLEQPVTVSIDLHFQKSWIF